MTRLLNIIIFLLAGTLFTLIVLNTIQRRPLIHPAGMIAPDDPIQEDLKDQDIILRDDFRITKLARFEITARILSFKRYRFDGGAALSPLDLALGWGPMSDQSVVDEITISQSGRFYCWRAKEYPIPRKDIERHSANMHLIPANNAVEDAWEKLRIGEVVSIQGYLVRADGPQGWHWKTSLTRKDTGSGACELVWVESFQIRA